MSIEVQTGNDLIKAFAETVGLRRIKWEFSEKIGFERGLNLFGSASMEVKFNENLSTAMTRFFSNLCDDIQDSPLVAPLTKENESLKAEVERLKKYETYVKMHQIMSNGKACDWDQI